MKHIINALIPLFGLIALGYLTRRFNLIGIKSAKVLNVFVMKIALPSLIFGSIATQKASAILNYPFICAFSLTLLLPYISCFWIGKLCRLESRSKSALRALSLSLPNLGYLGIPIMNSLYGKQGIAIASVTAFLSVAIIVPTMIICDTENKKGNSIKKVVQNITFALLKNTLAIAAILGFFYSWMELPMIGPLYTFIQLLGKASDPCALFALGELLFGQSLKKGLGEIGLNGFFKLAVQPLLALFFLWILQVDSTWAICGFLLSALPTGIIVSVLANCYHTYLRPGLATILVTTVLSFGTLLSAFYLSSKIWALP